MAAHNKLCMMLVFFAVRTQTSTAYDFLVLAMQWPPSLCNVGKTCVTPPKHVFTIHGLWPNVWMGKNPAYCTNTPFDPNLLSMNNQRSRLLNQWPNVYDINDSENFWSREWAKHGTCAENSGFPQFDYIELTLRLKNRYNLKKLLANAGINPGGGGTFSLTFIKNAIHGATQVYPAIICNGQSQSQLQEIRMCIDAPGSGFISCPARVADRCAQFVSFPN